MRRLGLHIYLGVSNHRQQNVMPVEEYPLSPSIRGKVLCLADTDQSPDHDERSGYVLRYGLPGECLKVRSRHLPFLIPKRIVLRCAAIRMVTS